MDTFRKPQNQRFRFLDQEQFMALTSTEKLAYLTAAVSELQRSAGDGAPAGESGKHEPRAE